MPIHQKSDLEIRVYKELMISYQIPGVTLVLTKDGVPILDQAFGFANLALNIPASTSFYTRIASISKVFTKQAILSLVRQGKIALETEVFTEIFNGVFNVPKEAERITVEMLLNHTVGCWPTLTRSEDPMFMNFKLTFRQLI
jgi:CubicO group peptidase (beta-lactamase class C family)